jgi:hypothetical protein
MRAVSWWAVTAVTWVASLTTVTWPELAVAALVAVPCALAATRAEDVLAESYRIRARWPTRTRALPVGAPETVGVWRAGVRRFPGLVREVRLGGERSPARSALAALLLAATPGALMADAEPAASWNRHAGAGAV